MAALQSYRCDSVLRPFPPRFVADDEDKDTEGLVSSLTYSEWLELLYVSAAAPEGGVCRLFLLRWGAIILRTLTLFHSLGLLDDFA